MDDLDYLLAGRQAACYLSPYGSLTDPCHK